MWVAATCLLVVTATTSDQARDLYRAGSEAYRQGRYAVAIDAFEEVLKLESRPQAIFSAAQAHRLQYYVADDLSHLERAVELYREYLAQGGGARRDHAAQHLSTLTPILEQRRIESDQEKQQVRTTARLIVSTQVKDATARVDGGPETPIPAAFEVSPGPHTVVVEAGEFLPQSLNTVALKGSAVALNVELQPSPGHLLIAEPAGAQLRVDGRSVGVTPTKTPLKPGRHLVLITDRGRNPLNQTVYIESGKTLEVDAKLSLTGQRVASYAAYGVGSALLIGSVSVLLATLPKISEASDLETRHQEFGLTTEEASRYEELRSSRDDFLTVGIGLGVGAVAFGVVATAMMIFDDPSPSEGLSVEPKASGAQVSLDRGILW